MRGDRRPEEDCEQSWNKASRTGQELEKTKAALGGSQWETGKGTAAAITGKSVGFLVGSFECNPSSISRSRGLWRKCIPARLYASRGQKVQHSGRPSGERVSRVPK